MCEALRADCVLRPRSGDCLAAGVRACRLRRSAEFVVAAGDRHRRSARATEPAQAHSRMDPDVLLREFLKATADPANRHLAARQFLTESGSSAWDDAGSALLIDNVVFVETRGTDRVTVHMRADILGSLSDLGVFETGEVRCPTLGRSNWSRSPAAGESTSFPMGFSLTGNSFRRPTNATPCIRRPDRHHGGARSALRRGIRPGPVGHRTGQQADRRATP